MSTVEELPLKRRTRSTDPDTSLAAARKAIRASARAIAAVQELMTDGRARTDQEIWEGCRAVLGYLSSLTTVQHARLALAEAGMLRDTQERRLTRDLSSSRVWVTSEPS